MRKRGQTSAHTGNTMNEAFEDKDTVLLTSCGIYPQVITEIIYALSQQAAPVEPTEVYVITTEVGMDQIKKYLLDETNGYFFRLCREYDLSNTRFELSNVKLLEDAVGIPLDDIQTREDNEVVANTITELVRKLTLDPRTALHVSLAGGRRTISYYLGYALSLFGRPQDRLSHTIVSREFEADDEFFYPNKEPTFITDRAGNTLNTQHAHVMLAEIPFVRLREGMPIDLLEGRTTFVEAVAAVPKVTKTAQLQIDLKAKTLIMNDVPVDLPPILFAWYGWLALRRKERTTTESTILVRGNDHKAFLDLLRSIYGGSHASFRRAEKALAYGFTVDYVSEKNSRINKRISQALAFRAYHFRIHSHGERPNTRYGLLLESENILVKEQHS